MSDKENWEKEWEWEWGLDELTPIDQDSKVERFQIKIRELRDVEKLS